MEPLRGGGLSKLSDKHASMLTDIKPDATPAQWAFRWVGSYPNVLTTLSGMNQMEHLIENVATHSPLQPCTSAENALLEKIADGMAGMPLIPCTTCAYCMPCPYGVDIPGNFSFYNDVINNDALPDPTAADYNDRRLRFVDNYNQAIAAEARANQCIDCEACLPKCPQQIRIPNQMSRIVQLLRNR